VSLAEKRLAWRAIERSRQAAELRIAILSTFTAEPLKPYLGLALEQAGLTASLNVGPYGQISQECLNPSGSTASTQPDIVVVWPRLEDLWAGKWLPLDDDTDAYIGELTELAENALRVRDWGASLVFLLPAVPEVRPLGVGDAGNAKGVFAVASVAREAARARLATAPGVLIADTEEVIRELGTSSAVDWRRAASARVPYQEATFAMVGDRIARLIALSRKGATKVVAVDADNTLWGGVIGEDGVAGIDLSDNGPGEAFRQFQSYLLEIRRSGMILALVSKNNEGDVVEAFARPEMNIQQTDFAAWRIGWGQKSASIAKLAEELNVGTSAVVLIDDSPLECAEVSTTLPEVHTIEMPADVAFWYEVISASGRLDRLPPTIADLTRADSYQRERDRLRLSETTSVDVFLTSLRLELAISSAKRVDISRAAQLVAKTNQFTLAGRRRSETELMACVDDSRYHLRLVSAADRFGDYGAIGLFIVDQQPEGPGLLSNAALLETFALSCRAMGRGIEAAMVAAAFELAGKDLGVIIHEGPKNEPARQFFAQLGCTEPGHMALLDTVSWPTHIRRIGLRQPAGA
jgi:FkbH-like protein